MMICKNCGATFSTDDPDENGIVVCPECGKKYRKKTSAKTADASEPEAQADETAATASERAASPFQRFMRYKIGGMLPAWCACFVLIFVAVLLIVTLLSGGGSIEGSWALVSAESGDPSENSDLMQVIAANKEYGAITLTFENGKLDYDVSTFAHTFHGTYETSGNVLTISIEGLEGSASVRYKVSGSRLTLYDGEQKLIFGKK